MEQQHFFDFLLTAASAAAAWIARSLNSRVVQLEKQIAGLHEVYVKRDDFRDFAERIYGSLERIETKLDSKADK